jgi:hypothetical protein
VRFRDGRFDLEAPATARLRVRADGYEVNTKSIFADYEPLLRTMLQTRSEQLADWSTFENIRRLLRDVRLEFAMRKTP